jgi:hypothetical protein
MTASAGAVEPLPGHEVAGRALDIAFSGGAGPTGSMGGLSRFSML